MKKKNLILSFLLIFSSLRVAPAQEVGNPLPTKIDSIQGLLDAQPRKDTLSVKRLNDLALLCFFDMQFQRGILAAKQARQLSQKLNYPKGEGLYLNFMMLMSGSTGFYYYFKKILCYAVIKEKEEPNKLMDLFPQKRDPEKVIEKLLEALKYFEKNNEKEMMAHILGTICTIYLESNKTKESLKYSDRALKLFKEIGRPELAAMASFTKAFALQAKNKMAEVNEIENDVKAIMANIKDIREKALLNFALGYGYLNILHKTALGFEHLLKADYELEKIGEKDLRTFVVESLGFAFDNVGLYQKAVDYFKKAIEFKIEAKKLDDIALLYAETVVELVPLKKFDEAKQYLEKARSFANDLNDKQTRDYFEAKSHDASGQILMGQGKYQEALVEFFKVTKMAEESQRFEEVFSKYMNSFIAQCYQKLGDWEKSILFAEKSYQQILIASESEDWLKIKTSLLLSEVYEETGQPTKAFEYLKKYRGHIKEKEEQDIANLATNLAIENFTQKNEQERAAFEKQKLIQRWWLFSISAALFSSFVFLYFLYQSNKHKQKANNLLSRQKEEINHQREKAEKTLTQLKTTQAQLVQSEKLASLGELTAGIAHEIQNPLNFVNNFAEVSAEMLLEMDAELEKGDIHEAKAISANLQQNLSKINHHGQRASAIVKGMLEHSRTGDAMHRVSTDLNALADEYLRLAYHGLRARDSSFNAVMETHFDLDLPKIEVIPQDIGRVLLNLINNAFYAVNEKAKQGIEGYSPMVTVSTKKLENVIEISVKDNGKGIPDNIKDKIFQPFFTTKPTGQGTGLGLSLAYDIVTKGHGGTLDVESTEGVGSAFTIKLSVV